MKHYLLSLIQGLILTCLISTLAFASDATSEFKSLAAKKNKLRVLAVESKSITTVLVSFSKVLKKKLLKKAIEASTYQIDGLKIERVVPQLGNQNFLLYTTRQSAEDYLFRIKRGRKGISSLKNTLITFSGTGATTNSTPNDTSKPSMVGALSTSNTTIHVAFNEPMGISAISPTNFTIVQENVNSEAAGLSILSAKFVPGSFGHSVELTTLSQSAVTYRVTAVGVFDKSGNPIATRVEGIGGFNDPSTATFAGTPPSGGQLVDTDGDLVSDNEEQNGWLVTILLTNGQSSHRQVTSDPLNPDTDNDGLLDGEEKALITDPRDPDTDDDQITDYSEFNEVYSEPTRQDTDEDSLYDGLEFNFFRTNPNFDDTDGDQIVDGDEVILANRDARLADIPIPGIEIGDVDLQLDVRFTAISQTGTRELQSKTVSSTLNQTESKEYSNTDSTQHEFAAKVTVEQGWEVGKPLVGAEGSVSVEAGYTGQWTSSFTESSKRESSRETATSLQSDVEATQDESVQRDVLGASMKIGVMVKTKSDVAFTISNIQVAAFVQDPKNSTRRIPVATLLPDANVPNEFSLGPLVSERGPFIFENDQIFPATVERLMLNPQGLTFKIVNYDITDELGRNFAFTSQEINDRTAPLVIDFGSADRDGDGIGDGAIQARVATSSGRKIDTNGDNLVDDNDRRVAFDLNGDAVGLELKEALEVIFGLTYYKEEETPTSSLTLFQRENSFSTKIEGGIEKIWRIKNISEETSNPQKIWYVFTPSGIDVTTPFSDLILEPGSGIRLGFVQDLDSDLVTASWEFVHGCSDTDSDSDNDGISDGDEVNIGWDVDVVGVGARKVYSSCARTDSDFDGISDLDEKNRMVLGNPAPLDPKNSDSDKDLVSDFDEINGYLITLRFPRDTNNDNIPDLFEITVTTDPLNPDSDGDSVIDGDEQQLGIDPTTPDGEQVLDDDADGLRNFEETLGYNVIYSEVSTVPGLPGAQQTCTPTSFLACGIAPTSAPNDADTDNDGLSDKQEKILGTHPRKTDTDGDGLSDFEEVSVTANPFIIDLVLDPLDADIDDDGRSDGDEVNTAILISVSGSAPYNAYSDPFVLDKDLDGLNDAEEASLGTDPNLFDTDEDTVSDRNENLRGTDPLTKDQLVEFKYTSIKVVGDCDPGTDGSNQWSGRLRTQILPAGLVNTHVNLHNGPIENVDEGVTVILNNANAPDRAKRYILKSGDSVRAFSNELCESDNEDDGNCDSNDEALTDFSQDFTFVISNSAPTTFLPDGGNDCDLEVTLAVTVIPN